SEDEAIRAMRAAIEGGDAYDDDQLLNLIDIIYDYYEDNGELDIDFDEDSDENAELKALTDHARRLLAKDAGNLIRPEHLPALIAAEIEYEMSLI
ncbi:MAG: hypothetical protein K2M12_09505, partial [Muribaculaceae bacterium]|nr:hypothetical protein [Muribaculaceae bacterium]